MDKKLIRIWEIITAVLPQFAGDGGLMSEEKIQLGHVAVEIRNAIMGSNLLM